MRWLVLVVLVGCTAPPHPDATINAVIGDTSFIRTFGRPPTAADDPHLRVATHLAYVELELRAKGATGVRARALDALHRYIEAGVFPHGELERGTRPAFVDAQTGARCAVADLVEHSAGTALMAAIDRDHHGELVADIAHDVRFVAWAATSGLSIDELALIQPEYEPARGENIEVDVAAGFAAARDAQRALAGGEARWLINDDSAWIFAPWIGVRGAFGESAGDLAYAAHALLGFTFAATWFSQTREVITLDAGFGADRTGTLAPRAWTVPLDLVWRRALIKREYGDHVGLQLGVHGGPRFTVGGTRDTGWAAGIDLTRRPKDLDYLVARDTRISLDAERIADTWFVGLSLGFAFRSEHRDLQ
jgi:hypothetical protein